jgi:hypothetical protein
MQLSRGDKPCHKEVAAKKTKPRKTQSTRAPGPARRREGTRRDRPSRHTRARHGLVNQPRGRRAGCWLAPSCCAQVGCAQVGCVLRVCLVCHLGMEPFFSATPCGRQKQLPMHRISLSLGGQAPPSRSARILFVFLRSTRPCCVAAVRLL